MRIELAGEARLVVTKADGTIKSDTGYFPNIILNQGLDILGGLNFGHDMFSACVVGSGNTTPTATQTALNAPVVGVTRFSSFFASSSYAYIPNADNTYKTWATMQYRFTGINNQNISEVGLVSRYSSITDHTIVTRALIKDTEGLPTSISVQADETLDVFYRVWQVFSTEDAVGTFSIDDGSGKLTEYNYIMRLAKVGNEIYITRASTTLLGKSLGNIQDQGIGLSSNDIGDIKQIPVKNILNLDQLPLLPYVAGSYKRQVSYEYPLTQGNGLIRTISLDTTMGHWQMRVGSVLDDSPINKTASEKLVVNFEFSWGRYTGEL